MTRRDDLTGRQFHEWTVLRSEGWNPKSKGYYYLCRCSCGKEKLVSASNLTQGHSTRCFKCGHSGDRNGWRQRALRANGGEPLMRGTPEYATAAACKIRAKAAGLEFGFPTISACARWIRDNTPETCPVFGTPLRRSISGGRFQRDAPSVDRIDSTKGYTPRNMQVISMLANSMKTDASARELRAFAEWVLRGC